MGKPKGGKFGGSKKPQKVDKLADEDMYDEIDMYHKKGKGKGADLRGLSVRLSLRILPYLFNIVSLGALRT